MHFLVIFLLAGLGLASAYPTTDLDVQPTIDSSWITDQMKETLERLLKGVEKAMDEGRDINVRVLKKAQDLVKKLSDLGVNVGDNVREVLDRLAEYIENKKEHQAESQWPTSQTFKINQLWERSRSLIRNVGQKIGNLFSNILGFKVERSSPQEVDILPPVLVDIQISSPNLYKYALEQYKNGYGIGKNRAEFVRIIGNKIIEDKDTISKEVVREFLVLLKEVKKHSREDYGQLYKEIQDIVNN